MRAVISIGLGIALTACSGGNSSAPTTSAPPTSIPASPPPPPANMLSFNNVTAARGIQHNSEFSASYTEMPRHFGGGAASGDIDNDGDIDVFIVRGDTQPNLLFVNDGGVFSEQADLAGLALPNGGVSNFKLSGPAFVDLDGDDDLDLFVGGLQNDPSLLFLNNGDGTFSDVTAGSGFDAMTSENTISVTFGDYDGDRDLDVAMAHWGTARDRFDPGETETLWRNDSDASGLKFVPISQAAGISSQIGLNLNGVLGVDFDYTFSPNFADIDNDGDLDLLSVSDFSGSRVFLNNGDGTFDNATDATQITDSNGMGSAVGDYNNDGHLDWFVSSIDGNRLYENMNGTLINVSQETGISVGSWGWGSCFADFNADGNLDIYQTNGWINNGGANPSAPYTEDQSKLWMSDGDGNFLDRASDAGMVDTEQGRGIVCADFDNDRDIDVLLLLNNSAPAAVLWNNEQNSSNAIGIDLKGPRPNTKGIGARIFVKTDTSTQMREVNIGSNFTSHNPTRQIFGLGDQTSISEVMVKWPDGLEVRLTEVPANQNIEVTHPDY